MLIIKMLQHMIVQYSQDWKLTLLGRHQLATDLFFSVAKWENVGKQLWNSGRQCKVFSRIGDQESAISNPDSRCVQDWMYQLTTTTITSFKEGSTTEHNNLLQFSNPRPSKNK